MKLNFAILFCILFTGSVNGQTVKYVDKVEDLKSHKASSKDEVVFIPGKKGGYFKYSKQPSKSKFAKVFCKKQYDWERIIPNSSELNALWFGADDEDDKDDTEAIQCAIDALPSQGGKVIIPLGCTFRLKDLNFSERTTLEYYADSDKSGDAGAAKATNEKIEFIANANKQGIVNESILAAPFHPGLILNVKKDIKGQLNYLGKGQTMNNPVRASFIIQDEGLNQVMQQYMVYPDYYQKYSGWRLGLFRNTYLLKGVSVNDFPQQPKTGDLIESKNGKGHLVEADRNSITVQWFSGRFKKGDKLFCGKNNYCRKSTKGAEFKTIPFNSLSLNRINGYVGIGVPNSNALQPLTVGGRIGIQSSRQHGQYVPEEIKMPSIVFADSFEAENPVGMQLGLSYNKRGKARIVLTDYEGKKEVANVGAVSLHTSFDKSLRLANSSFNTRKIERESKGVYWIYFKTTVTEINYQVTLGTSRPLEYAYCDLKEKNRIRVKIVKTGTDRPVDPEGGISVICAGGF
ncbi:hypothetical protein N9229_01835 [Saprospiraceae bacterium]|nr:hypothetical protein [Saprospiraceae bacterium]